MSKRKRAGSSKAKPGSKAKSSLLKKPLRTKARRSAGVQQSETITSDYSEILDGLTQLIRDSRRRAAASVNRELVCLYWHIGRVIVRQQENAQWGDAVVEKLSADLRSRFPEMKGLTKDNLFRMRKFVLACRELDNWLPSIESGSAESTPERRLSSKVGAAPPQMPVSGLRNAGSGDPDLCDQGSSPGQEERPWDHKVGALSPQFQHPLLRELVLSLSWTHLTMIVGATESTAEQYFYLTMATRERWSVRELRRQIDAALFERYTTVRRNPEKCLPIETESGDLLPFRDHYVLEFLGLADEHSERELRKSILANLMEFFLEFGKDLAFVGEEYPLTIGSETFFIDLLFYHRRLRCLIAVDLKRGKFKAEYVGKARFYCTALDEQIRLPHENPSLGLVLCRSADAAQVRLALTAAAERIGVATYQTALPDESLLMRRLEQLPPLPEERT